MSKGRSVAVKVLGRVERHGAFAAAALAAEDAALSDPREAALAHELVLGVLRRRPWLDHLLDSVAERGIGKVDPKTRSVLRVGAYQIAFMKNIPASVAVFDAVDEVKRSEASRLAGLVNALLRTLGRKPAAFLRPKGSDDGADLQTLSTRLGMPPWLFERLVAVLGREGAVKTCEVFNRASRRTLRINTGHVSRQDALRRLGDRSSPGALSPFAVDAEDFRLAKAMVEEGAAAYQDEAAQLASLALDPRPSDRILDACAGRGGKTAAIAMMQGKSGDLTAMDRSQSKLERLSFELNRQGFHAKTVDRDLAAGPLPRATELGGPFDKVLLDAPCSGSGTMGRRPEIRWRLDESDIGGLVALQERLLDTTADLVVPGGRLVYVVCSLLPEEGLQQAEHFLSRRGDYALAVTPPPLWPRSIPWRRGCVRIGGVA
jgi:16S rRNA (cytosine967-C5)-methyltransferase